MCFIFFFKQKTAYEMRISDWSSDVCSSDLLCAAPRIRIASAMLLAGAGVFSVMRTPLDALPDLSDTQVIIRTSWAGQSPQVVEIGRASCRERVCQYV